ncbi:MAG: DUF86 domain-containing protein [Actinobacteria bacterium]|nr:DUF86 domain-containing protein [Actinomycetota bacterium]
MKRDIRVYIEDMLASTAKIQEYTKGISGPDFSASTQLQDAVLRRLEILGEAAKNVPPAFRNKHPDIPWKKIAGLRDILIHEYFGVNLQRVWKAAKQDVVDLADKLAKAKQDLEQDNS